MKAECISLVCRMVKVFFPSAATTTSPHKKDCGYHMAADQCDKKWGSRNVVSFSTSFGS